MFKVDNSVSSEGRAQVITREPGLYKMAVSGITEGSKAKGKDEDPIRTINIELTVLSVDELVDKTLDPRTLVGKKHTDQIKLGDVDSSETFNKRHARVKHIVKKSGITEDAMDKVVEAASKAAGKDEDLNKFIDAYITGMQALLTPEIVKAKKPMNFKVLGGVLSGNPFTAAPGFLGFASELDKEQKFTAAEYKQSNEYYAAIKGQTPSGEGDGGSTSGGAF